MGTRCACHSKEPHRPRLIIKTTLLLHMSIPNIKPFSTESLNNNRSACHRSDDAAELFSRIRFVITAAEISPSVINKTMHETLVIACVEGLKGTRYGFGDLNSQVESLMRILKIPANEAAAIRRMRRHSNHSVALSADDLRYDAKALADLISRIYATPLPDDLTKLLPHGPQKITKQLHVNAADKRCIVQAWDDDTITAVVDEENEQNIMTIRYNDNSQHARMEYLKDILREGMHLNLLGCQVEGNTITPRLIIVEPDCLLDISTIASCFEDYGHHPLLYLVSRMRERANNQAILLGNFAGSALDDIINQPDFNMGRTLIRNFREKALEYATCPDFDGNEFKQNAVSQIEHLKQIIHELRQHFDLSKAVLEPTFVCEKLGIQGRVDLMTTDLRLLVEQKSGRNIFLERSIRNCHGTLMVEKHYVQVLLYFGILFYNFNLSDTDIRLLYSRYALPDGLLSVANLMTLVYEALRFRNEAVALEFDIAERGLQHLLPLLTPETMNVNGMRDYFYERYLLPQLQEVLVPLQKMSPLEQAYFCRMMQFVIRENIMSKVGVNEGIGNSVANLWNMPLSEKRETGNIYTHLTITHKEKDSDGEELNGYDLITLAIPEQGNDFLPNFRRGDMVFLYSYPEDEEPDVRKALLFKGGIAALNSSSITIKLTDGQQNADIFNQLPYNVTGSKNVSMARAGGKRVWCIEHASSDVGGSAGIRALYTFVTSTESRKQLLLNQREPKANTELTLSRSYNEALDPMLTKAKQALDYFLLVGPPGTGKTSMALRFLVEEQLATCPEGGILLMAYTNRAVDEICGMLVEAGVEFIRIGSKLSCAVAYEPYLLSNIVGKRPTLEEIKQKLGRAQVIVGTTSMIQSRDYIFNLRHFSLAIIDEASQILEPNIIGLLASHREKMPIAGKAVCDIDKFILIGDYKQLPAVVQQNDNDSAVTDPLLREIGLTTCKGSLFERLIRSEIQAGRTAFMDTLHRQGRMHPDIEAFPREAFYLKEGIEPVPLKHQKEKKLGYTAASEDDVDDLLKAHRLLFFASEPCLQPELSDKVNASEARIVADLLRRIHRFYGRKFDPDKTVGVIVPYRNQIGMIRKEIEALHIPELESVSIDTVERYQGSQRDVIVYSFTIQRRYQLDFLTSNSFQEDDRIIDRKLNVALTRARRQLLLTGNLTTLSANPVFDNLIAFARLKGAFVTSYPIKNSENDKKSHINQENVS